MVFIAPSCSKPDLAIAPPAEEERHPEPAAASPLPAVESEEAASSAPAASISRRQARTEPLPENAFELERLYYSGGTPPAKRVEIIRALGSSGSAGAVELLGRLFEKEKRFETKATILEVAGDLDKELHRERLLTLLSSAAGPKQPRTVREIALLMLADIEDPRAVALLRSAQSDSDSVIKKVAAEVLRDLAP